MAEQSVYNLQADWGKGKKIFPMFDGGICGIAGAAGEREIGWGE
jgi:hypothetical protein